MPNEDLYRAGFTIPEQLHLDGLSFDKDLVTIHASTVSSVAECPLCKQPSRRIHGCHTRRLSDLPWCGTPVRLRVRVREFFCDESSCERKIFAERLGGVARLHARSTGRQGEALEWIAFAPGGEAGARLARELGLLVSPDTLLLQRIRGAPRANDTGEVRALGVDDFGFRKGNAPGIIMADLERHKVVDLFEGHSAGSIARWLRQHPEVEVVSRDRSPVRRAGIDAGAPEARQVTDRWHLLHNLTQLLEEFLLQKRPALRDATSEAGTAESRDGVGSPDPAVPNDPGSWRARKEEAARKRHERLVEQWRNIRRLHLAGADVRFIARKLGIGARTVYRYKDLSEPPSRQSHRSRASVLDPYVTHLPGRWNEGCRNGKRLFQEIQERGYDHGERTSIRFTAELRRMEAAGKPPSFAPRARKGSVAGLSPSAKNVAAPFMRREEKLSEEQKEYLGRPCASDESLSDARRLTQEFAKMVRGLEGEELDGWLEEAQASDAPVMEKFAAGLKKEQWAVKAGLTERWSTGPVEGFINKVKLLKRQG